MNLRDLRYLVNLANHRHFGRAAEASFVSQPTLSTQLKKLEEELGMPLVERSPRHVLLTELGEKVAERARVILREADEIRAVARRFKDPEAGRVRIGIFPTLGPYLLPHVVPDIVKRFPKLELELAEEKTEVILKKLTEGELDAGVLALPIHDEQLHTEFLFEEAFVFAAPAAHPLAKARRIKLSDLNDQPLLLLDEGHCLRDQALEVCQRAGATERGGFRATSLETLRNMVAANAGATLLPALAVQGGSARLPNVKLVPFAAPGPHRRIAMVWRRTSALTGILQALAQRLKAIPKDMLRAPK
ncbi:MAG: LysR family transcriptional regulator [Betaproteobacteria bacterium]|nr:LysR family transcriptional regulator [Betaproteobacteria bacterium]